MATNVPIAMPINPNGFINISDIDKFNTASIIDPKLASLNMPLAKINNLKGSLIQYNKLERIITKAK